MNKEITNSETMEPKTIRKNGISTNWKNFLKKMFCLLFMVGIVNNSFAQFTVWQSGSQVGPSYTTWQEAVYRSSIINPSQVRDNSNTVIYERNNSEKYWMFQANPYPSYASTNPADAYRFITEYPITNAIVLQSNGIIYGARTNGKNNPHIATETDMEANCSYVYKWSVSRTDWQSMSAILDLSQCVYNTPGYYQQYPANNLYIYGQLRHSGSGSFGGYEDWGFIKGPQGTEWRFIAPGYTGNYSIGLYDIVYLEWKLEDVNNRFAFYVNGEYIYSKSCNVSSMRQSNMKFLMATTMVDDYTNGVADAIINFRDNTFFGPVKWRDCKLKLTSGTEWNFWIDDSQQSIYANQQTCQVLQPYSSGNNANQEVITLSHTGSFTPPTPGCLSVAPHGQYPSTTFTPTCTGSNQTIAANCWAGEYSVVQVTNGIPYTFSSSISSDYLTIANSTGTTILATGTGSVNWTATSSTTIRFYTHTNSSCGTSNTNRSRMVRCTPTSTQPNLQLMSLTVNGTLYQNQTGSFTAQIKNNGNGAYNSRLYAYLENPVQWVGNDNSHSIAPGETKTITFTGIITLSPGLYNNNVIFDANNNPSNPAFYQFNNLQNPKVTIYPSPPPNDLCSNATTLPFSTTVQGNLTGATPTTNISYSNYPDRNDVFYQFTPTITGNHTITLNNFLNDKDLFLYSNCSTASALASSAGTSPTETITYNCTAGTNYRIRVVDYSGTGGTFNIKVDPPCFYTASFDAQGGTVNPSSKTITCGTTVGTLPTPMRNCYTFGGWWTGTNGTGIQYMSSTIPNSNITLYAKWTINTYTLTFNAQGGTVNPTNKTINCGDAAGTLPTPTRDCYTFGGWWTGTNGTGTQYISSTVPNSNITLYAKWTINTYTLTFNAQGGTVNPSSKTVSCGEAVSILPTPSLADHVFEGWWTGTNGTGAQYTSTTIANGSITLYAKWGDGNPALELIALAPNSPLYQYQSGSFTATVKNNGTAAYNSHLWVYMEKPDIYDPRQWIGDNISYNIAPGETKNITFTGIINLSPDLYASNLLFDANNNPNDMAIYQFGSHPSFPFVKVHPSNDLCSNAIPLHCGISVTGTLYCASPSTTVSYSEGAALNDVFYIFTTEEAGEYTFVLAKSNSLDDIDLGLHLSCNATNSLIQITNNNNIEAMSYYCTANTTYMLRAILVDGTGESFTVTVYCPEPGGTTDDGVIINGVKWATRNVGKPGTFAANYESPGWFYQWNRKMGWSNTDPMINSNGGTTWDSSIPSGANWEAANNPCPTGWRVPTRAEYASLIEAESAWTQVGGKDGRRLTDQNTGDNIFIPAAGVRWGNNAVLADVGSVGWYWTGTPSDNTNAYFLFFDITRLYQVANPDRSHGFPIRCVSETYTLTALAGGGGIILPNGTQTVNYGDDKTFTATPDECYEVNHWKVNGLHVQSGGTSYTIQNVQEDATVEVVFSLIQFSVSASAGSGGEISPDAFIFEINCGTKIDFVAIPDICYEVDQWIVNGSVVQTGGTTYLHPGIQTNTAVYVTFKARIFTEDESEHFLLDIEPELIPIAPCQVADWLINLDRYYEQLVDLMSGFVPFEGDKITIRSVSEEEIGYAWARAGNPITWNNCCGFIPNTFTAFANNGDWSFGILHEIGHNFANYIGGYGSGNNCYNWNEEMFANFRMYLALSKLSDAMVNMGGFRYGTEFWDINVQEDYFTNGAGNNKATESGLDWTLVRLGDYYQQNGDRGYWLFKQAFEIINTQLCGNNDRCMTQWEKFNYFLDILSICVGSDVRETYTTHELNLIELALTENISQLWGPWKIGNPTATDVIATFENGTLTISGTGTMENWYYNHSSLPWFCVKDEIINVIINEGVTSIGNFAFMDCSNLTSVTIPNSVTSIGNSSASDYDGAPFFSCNSLTDVTVKWSTPLSINSNVFAFTNISNAYLHVPPGTECLYAAAPIWQNFNIPGAQRIITSFAGTGGVISPPGVQTVDCNGSQTFYFIPDDPCYEIDQVLIDGENNPDAAANGSYTFENVAENHIISVSFKIKTITITAEVIGGNGTIMPDGETPVFCGTDKTFVFQPDECYHITQVWIDGVENPDAVVNGYYIFLNITEEHSISVSFTINTYTVTPLETNGGSIFPDTPQTVECGEDITFIATPNDCQEVDQWIVNGIVVQEGETSFTVSDILENTTVGVTFKTKIYTIMATNGANGSIEPNGATTVLCGDSQTFTFTPDECYRIAQVWVNGQPDLDAVENGFYTFENVTENYTIHVTFAANNFYTITATSGANGSISPDGEVSVLCKGSQRFDFYPDEYYKIEQAWIDGVENPDAVADGFYIFENVTEPRTLHVTFASNAHTITATAGSNGTITPSGIIIVEHGASKTFEFTPDEPCYEIDQVLIDGVNNPDAVADGFYTFENVTENHTISVNFKIKSLNITTEVIGGNGAIIPDGELSVICGTDKTFVFQPDECYHIAQVWIDGVENPDAVANGYYIFLNVTEEHSISVSFAINTYIFTPLGTNGGSIFPDTPQTVECGEDITFTATPNDCQEVDQWIVNGVVVQEGGTSYTVSDIRENTTISVTFKTITYTIMATCGANGSIDPNGFITVLCGSNQIFIFTPDECYRIAQVLIDGQPNLDAVENGFYTFLNVTENHTIYVDFVANNFYTITAEVIGGNGSISPDGIIPVLCSGSQRFDFYPDECYEIKQVWIDGVENSDAVADGFYIFENITANHTIDVSFKIKSITIIAMSGEGGTISPSGDLTIDCGNNITFIAFPDDCHEVFQWIVNGIVAQEGGISYTLNVQENTTIEVTFKRKTYTIQPTVINGSVDPSGVQTVECGNDITFCFTPNPGYEIDKVYVDGELQELTNGCYTFYNVTENHTIFVTGTVGITENSIQEILIYPNPAKDEFYIKSELEIKKVEVYSITGALLLSDNYYSGKISIAALAKGIYFVKVHTDKGMVVSKVVKE